MSDPTPRPSSSLTCSLSIDENPKKQAIFAKSKKTQKISGSKKKTITQNQAAREYLRMFEIQIQVDQGVRQIAVLREATRPSPGRTELQIG